MSTNSIFVPYTGLRSTANAVGAYVKDWKSVAQFSFAPEDLMKPGFIGSAVAVYRNAKHCEINGEKGYRRRCQRRSSGHVLQCLRWY